MKTKDCWVEKFLAEAAPKIVEAVRPSHLIIFGSRARGEAEEASDLDVIVVADFFEGIPFLKRMPMLLKLIRFEKHVDFLCYTCKEFEKLRETSSIIQSALREGIVVIDGPKVGKEKISAKRGLL